MYNSSYLFRIFLSLSLFFSLAGQSILLGQKKLTPQSIDSLQQIIQQTNSDSIRYNVYSALAKGMAVIHLDSARMYADQLIQLSETMGAPVWEVRAWGTKTDVFWKAGRIDSINVPARQAVRISEACQTEACFSEKLHAVKLLREPFRERGEIRVTIQLLEEFYETPGLSEALKVETRRLIAFPLIELGDHDQALKELNLVWNYGQKVDDRQMMCNVLYELSFLYLQMQNIDKALSLAKQRLTVCESTGSLSSVLHCFAHLGSLFQYVNQLDSALFYFQKQQESIIENDLDFRRKRISMNLLGVALQGGKLSLADKYASEILTYLEGAAKDVDISLKGNMYIVLSEYYKVKGKNQLAFDYAKRHLDIIRGGKNDTTEAVTFALEELARTQALVGDYKKAWLTFDTFYHYRVALINRNQQAITAQTEVEMDLAANNLARQRAEQATLLEQQASTGRTRFFVVLLLIVGLLMAAVSWAYRRARHDRQLIEEKNQLVEQSLAEKEVLLREIHHRVKNNLQIISGLLDKQARKSSDAAVRKLVKEGQERIQSMALIHQNLYESDHISRIDIKSYLRELSANIQKSQAINTDQVQLKLNVEAEKIDIDTAIPVGLILNELLTNSYKYAFAGKGKGEITIDFKKEKEQYSLKVSDNGIGFIPEQTNAKTKSLGLSLVNGLVRQLGGTIKWLKPRQGTAVDICF